MTLAELSIRRPVMAWMLMAALIIFGCIGLGRLGVSQLPDYDFPVLNVNVSWPGTAPEFIEAEIVDRLEEQLITVEKIKDISSSIKQGSANITLEFEFDRNIDAALQEVQSKIAGVRMPKNVDPPTIGKSNPDDQPILYIGISSSRPLKDLIVYSEVHLRDQFQIIPGVGDVFISGGAARALRIWIDPAKLREYEITVVDVRKAIEMEHYEVSAGYLENAKQETNLRVMGEGMSVEQIENIRLLQRGGSPIYNSNIRIRDIARVENGLTDVRRVARVQGKPGIGIGIKKQRGTNAVDVAQRVKKRMEELAKTLPPDIEMGVNFDATRFIEESIHETMFTLVLSALITGLICFLFLGTWSSTFNILLSIPTSIIGTFLILYGMGFTLNMFTLLGLSLAIGIVVDDAIMVLENIVRHAEMGKDRVTAARDGAKEITFAAVAATVSVMAIFVPVLFVSGTIGKFLFQFGVAITGAVALSLLEALTITPMRCSQFLAVGGNQSNFEQKVNGFFEKTALNYRSSLEWCLNHRWKVVGGALLFFVLSLGSAKLLRGEIVPPQDQSMFLLRLQSPIGTSLWGTEKLVVQVQEELLKWPEVRRIFASVGGMTGGDVTTGIIFLSLKPAKEREASQEELMQRAREKLGKIPGLKLAVQDLSMRGFTARREFPIEFAIRGADWDQLRTISEQFLKEIEAGGLMTDLDTDHKIGQPEIQVIPNREAAAQSGVSMQTIGDTIEASMGGVHEGKFTSDGRRYDVWLKFDQPDRSEAESMDALQVRTAFGELIPLSRVVKLEKINTVQQITRRNRERSITIFANILPGKSQAEAIKKVEAIGKRILPDGYRLYWSGGAQAFQESLKSGIVVLLMGIMVAYMILASQFNSFLHPITVLLALPFSISGALLALLATNQSINLYSFIGMILLMGIVKKNSILLVEFTNQKRAGGLSLKEAILTASPIRLRPILMTSIATMAAALPPALALGPGAESRIPMAVTILGGVFVSTSLTLFVIPCAYSLFAPLERRPPGKEDMAGL